MTESNLSVLNEIPVADMDRAQAFCSAILDTEIAVAPFGPGMTMGFLPMDPSKPGAGGALVLNERYQLAKGRVMTYLASEDIEAQFAKITDACGIVITPKTPVGEHGNIAHFLDTGGNLIGRHSQ